DPPLPARRVDPVKLAVDPNAQAVSVSEDVIVHPHPRVIEVSHVELVVKVDQQPSIPENERPRQRSYLRRVASFQRHRGRLPGISSPSAGQPTPVPWTTAARLASQRSNPRATPKR